MTESVSSSGTEDVLSSIRKLVSSAPSPSFVPHRASASARPAPGPASDKLLLTPALRVPDPDVGPDPIPPAPRGMSLEDRIAELEAAVGGRPDDYEPDGSELGTTQPPDDLRRAVEDIEIVENAADAAAEAAGGDAPFVHAVPEDIPATVPLFFARHDHMEIRPAAEDAEEAVPHTTQDDRSVGVENAETEGDMSDAAADHPPEFRHDAGPATLGDNSRMFDEELSDAPEVDEAVLRAFVAKILSDELQGELGEKITRNVRKLVRREIERALALRDYD